MTVATEPLSSQTIPEVIFPPGNLWSDEPPLESDLHRDQIDLLIRLLKTWWQQEQQQGYVSGNLTIYYSPNQKKSEDFRGPDFFVVLGATPQERRSWAVWQEGGQYPHVIVELLSDSTASVDRGLKKELYQNTWRVPEYFWFHPDTLEFEAFRLVNSVYEVIAPNPEGWRWSQQLQLFLGIHERKLRFFTPTGQIVPLPEVAAQQRAEQAETALEQERQRAEKERHRAEQEHQRAERLAQRLKDLGIED